MAHLSSSQPDLTSKRAYMVLFTAMFITMLSSIGIAMPYPVLAPLFMDTSQSALTSFAGLHPKLLLAAVLATYPLGLLLGAIWLGGVSDVYGRKRMLIFTLIISVFGFLVSAWALHQEAFLVFVLSRFITGMFQGNVAITRAIAADLHPVIDKTRSFSWMYATLYSAWLLGPLLGGFLMSFSAAAVFAAAAISMAIAVILTGLLVPADPALADNTPGFTTLIKQQNALTLLSHKELRHMFYIASTLALGLNAFYEFYPLWLVETFSFNSGYISYSTAIMNVAMILTSALLVETIKRKFGKITTIKIAVFMFALALLITPLTTMNYLPILFVAIGVSIGLYNGLLQVYFSDRYATFGQGKLLSLLTMTFYLASAIIAIVGGVISLFGAVWALVTGGIILLAGLAYLTWYDIRIPAPVFSEPATIQPAE